MEKLNASSKCSELFLKWKWGMFPRHSIFTAILVPAKLCQQGFLLAVQPTRTAFLLSCLPSPMPAILIYPSGWVGWRSSDSQLSISICQLWVTQLGTQNKPYECSHLLWTKLLKASISTLCHSTGPCLKCARAQYLLPANKEGCSLHNKSSKKPQVDTNVTTIGNMKVLAWPDQYQSR